MTSGQVESRFPNLDHFDTSLLVLSLSRLPLSCMLNTKFTKSVERPSDCQWHSTQEFMPSLYIFCTPQSCERKAHPRLIFVIRFNCFPKTTFLSFVLPQFVTSMLESLKLLRFFDSGWYVVQFAAE